MAFGGGTSNLVLFGVVSLVAMVTSTPTSSSNNNSTPLDMFWGIQEFKEHYDVPKLPYPHDALEPWIEEKTLVAHHNGHLAAYTAKMNNVLLEWRKSGEEEDLAKSSLINILRNIDRVPEKWRSNVRNNVGGYVNHLFYFTNMNSNPTDAEQPMPISLFKIFRKSFHNYTEFRIWLSREALQHPGSGYVWLCRVPTHDYLTVYRTENQVCPISHGLQPLLVIDVWEHAYYLTHQYRRTDYIENWWNVISWEKVERLYNWWMSIEPVHDEL